ncbi:MAG: pyruvate kinase [Thermodesulfobacteriaceae bacterium]|nr:pyruvate kinase [Thermodesulfobacteriaceae bacterium]MDW8135772.1 pyruvate kinase [Thermodesulfobacterium sp.]
MKKNLIKIIATLGPSSKDERVITDMAMAGVEAFRINMSYGDQNYWDQLVEAVIKTENFLGYNLGLIADLEGPKIRLGDFETFYVNPGQLITFSLKPQEGIPLPHPEFFEIIREGDVVYLGDGSVKLLVEAEEGWKIKLKVLQGSKIEPLKGVAVAGKEIEAPALTSKDIRCLKYIVERPFSHVMVSYAKSPEQIEVTRAFIRDFGKRDLKILAKIETPTGVRRIGEIVQVADGVVVARGDLGVHFNLEELPIIQKELVRLTRSANKPIILATEFLSSMIERDVPTRSEVVDIYQAVNLSVDALMLTNETAIGKDPVKTVQWMYKILLKAQQEAVSDKPQANLPIFRLAKGLVELVDNLNANLILYSKSGKFVERIASFRPNRRYYVGVPDERVARIVRILWASEPIVLKDLSYEDLSYEEGLRETSKVLKEKEKLSPEQSLVEAAWSRDKEVYIISVKNLISPDW